MLGVNQRVRNTPVSSRTTKLHSAISPSMNDQWSGKTLRSCFLASEPSPSRSSAQVPTAPMRLALPAVAGSVPLVLATFVVSMSATLPEARSHGFVEVALRHEVSLTVHHKRQLGE